MASLRYTLNYLHSSQQIFSLRSNIGVENMTFKWLACTSQESIKIRTRGKERNRAKERYPAREKEIQCRARRNSARGSFNHGNLQTTLIKVLAGKIWWYASSWSSDVNLRGIFLARAGLAWRADTSPITHCKNIAGTISYWRSNWLCW